jgi:asparagine synthase (glutamine-hydrolysing)
LLNNISNLLTLRYDPSALVSTAIRNITYKEILAHRQRTNDDNIPSSKDLENIIRRLIKMKIEESRAKHITVALSSGIDSNVILSLIRKEFPNINIECLNVSFDNDFSEVRNAREIAQSQNAGFHEIYIENPLKDLPMLLSIIKEPRWNIYQYYFIEKARTISNMLFTGDGGDELFAGYTFRYKKFLENIKLDHSWVDRTHTYLLCHERDWVPDQEDMFGVKIKKFAWHSIYLILKKFFDNNLDPLEQLLLADYHGKLMYDFIPTNEKYFKHFNLNGIAPLLSNEIIDRSVRIPASLKYDYAVNIGKIQLREIIKCNASSYPIENKKMGFGINLVKFWFSVGEEIITSTLEKARIFEDKIINKEWYIKSLIRISQNNDLRYISKMLQLLSLEIWYKLFITHEMSAGSSL